MTGWLFPNSLHRQSQASSRVGVGRKKGGVLEESSASLGLLPRLEFLHFDWPTDEADSGMTSFFSPAPPPSPFSAAFHSRPVPGPDTCRDAWESDPHDRTAMILSLLIIGGMIISYLPQVSPVQCGEGGKAEDEGQHYRIIHARSSEGFSPWFLLLGATSSASSMLNIVTLQWGQVACCQYLVSQRARSA